MLLFGALNWQIQERIAPGANQRQDELRSQIRSRGSLANKVGKFWVANEKRIYSFELDDQTLIYNNPASDNDPRSASKCPAACAVRNLTIYEFDSVGETMQALYRVESAVWESDRIRFTGAVQKSSFGEEGIATKTLSGGELEEDSNPFAEVRTKPSHLTLPETRAQQENSESELEHRLFGVAAEKKQSTIFLPFIIALFTAPFALNLSRKGKAVTVGYAVGLWLLFMGLTNTFEQFGSNGYIGAEFAIWAPLFIFSMLGVILLSRVRT